MRCIVQDRQTGKTTKILKMAAATPDSCIFTHSERERRRLLSIIEADSELRQHITPERVKVFQPGALRGTSRRAFIDNLDIILQGFLGGPIDTVSCVGGVS